jgi:hypothetical protein
MLVKHTVCWALHMLCIEAAAGMLLPAVHANNRPKVSSAAVSAIWRNQILLWC